jgi:glutathione S-transferase
VRKVLAAMNLKGLAYEVDPITPFFGNDEFERLSPLRRIPVLIDGDFSISDSTVICDYLDDAYSGHPLYPGDPRQRARARWFEEFADTRLGDLFIWSLFYQKVVRPMVWGEPTDEERVAKAEKDDIPATLDYLEDQLPTEGFLFGDIGVADIAIASFFRNGAYAASKPMTNAGRVPPPSFSESSRIPASPPCCRSRMSSAVRRSRDAGRRSSMRVLHSLSKRWAFASRARDICRCNCRPVSKRGPKASARCASSATASME